MSKYLGGYPLRWNAEKLMLLDKSTVVRIFGQGLGVYALRSKYHLAYATYGITCGITDPLQLEEYGERKLIKEFCPRLPTMLQLQNVPESLTAQQEDIHNDEAEPSSKRARYYVEES